MTPSASTVRNAVGSPLSSQQVLDREFLEMRAQILHLAASFDRIQRSGQPDADPDKLQQLRRGLEILLSDSPQRAAAVQLLFSRPYHQDWPAQLGVPVSRKA